MAKIAFLFAGQGAQYVGMGKELYENFEEARQVFDDASERLGMDLKALCFEGPEEALNLTENTQPAIVTTSLAALKVLEKEGIQPEVVAGLSLGEYSALVCAGAMDALDAVALVKKRGKYMQEAVPVGVGTMAAILGLSKEETKAACEEARELGVVEPANFNCPGQIVIAGEVKAVERASELALQKGAKRALPLQVSGPFHTSMLKPAAEKLSAELENIEIQEPKVSVITNVTADFVTKENLKENLTKQVMSSVLWEDTVLRMIEMGVDTFIEIGPGKALGGFVKKVDRKLNVMNIEDLKSLENTLQKVRG